MARIEVRYNTGEAKQILLSKKQPVSIGRQDYNEVCIDEDGIAPLHCRIAWNKLAYEVVAAGSDGVDVNGTLVRHAQLQDGDLIRVGTVDIAFIDRDGQSAAGEGREQPAKAPLRKSEVDLKPVTPDELYLLQRVPEDPARSKGPTFSPTPPTEKRKASDDDPPRGRETAGNDVPDDVLAEQDVFEDEEFDEPQPVAARGKHAAQHGRSTRPRDGEDSLAAKLRARPRARPGEEDLLRSPFLLGLTGGVLALLLVALIFYFMIGRQSSQRLYDAAVQELNAGRYTQAIQRFEEFLQSYPNHQYADEARIGLGKARIENRIAGSTPNWQAGLKDLDLFLKQNRDRDNFENYRAMGLVFARRIALGAARLAERSNAATDRRRDLLAVAKQAETLLNRYGRDAIGVQLEARIARSFHAAEDAIRKQEAFEAAVAEIELALENNQPMAALGARNRLITRYGDLKPDRRLNELLHETLQTERALVAKDESQREAAVEPRERFAHEPLTLALHARSRTEELSEGRVVFATAKDCCYGVDTITGEPLWRRVIGLDSPFFPMEVSTSTPGLLLFDTNHRELVVLNRNTGQLLWRQALAEDVRGPPLVHEGQVYVPTAANHLYKIDLENGRITSRLTFSQRLVGPPVLAPDGDHLIVAGNESLLYAVSLRPMECRGVSYLKHGAGSLTAPMIVMGSLLLVAENDRVSGATLHVLDVRNPEEPLRNVAAERLEGHVRDEPLLRGRQLFVATDAHAIFAYSVNDDPSQKPIARIAGYQVQQPYDGPLFLSAGPDGQLWMASSALRKFQLQAGNIQLDPNPIAAGISTQPLQVIGRNLFVGRRFPYSRAVLFTQVERDEMTSQWRAELGAAVRMAQRIGDGSAVCLTESGHLFRVRDSELAATGFKQNPFTTLDVDETLTQPLHIARLADGRVAVHAGGAAPRLWILNPAGQVTGRIDLQQPLQADPVSIAAGIVLPLPGRLKIVGSDSSTAGVEDFLAPVENQAEPTRWACLARLNGEELFALDTDGTLLKLQYRTTPVANLTQVAQTDFEQPADVPMVIDKGRLIIALADGRMQTIDASTMEPLSEIALRDPAAVSPWVLGDRLFVETAGYELACYDLSAKLALRWSLPLKDSALAGSPLAADDAVILALQNGEVWNVDGQGGNVRNRLDVGQLLHGAPERIGDSLVVFSIDGSLYRVESILKTGR